MEKRFFAAAALVLAAANAHARCDTPDSTIFSCTTQENKKIHVCQNKGSVEYIYGIPWKAPEISIKSPQSKIEKRDWNGVGRWESYSIRALSGGATYSIFWSLDRQSKTGEIEAGVDVIIDGKTIESINCDIRQRITRNFTSDTHDRTTNKAKAELTPEEKAKRREEYKKYRLESIAKAYVKYGGKIISDDAQAKRIVDGFNIDCRMQDRRILPLNHLLYMALGQGYENVETVFILDRRGKAVRIYRESYKDGKVVTPMKMYYEINEWGELKSPVVPTVAILTACDINSDIGPMWLLPGELGY